MHEKHGIHTFGHSLSSTLVLRSKTSRLFSQNQFVTFLNFENGVAPFFRSFYVILPSGASGGGAADKLPDEPVGANAAGSQDGSILTIPAEKNYINKSGCIAPALIFFARYIDSKAIEKYSIGGDQVML